MFKYIVYFFDLKLPEGVKSSDVELYFNIGMMCLVIFSCLFNVIGYLISMHLVKYYDVETRYPKYKRVINFFLKSSWVWVIVESIIGFGGLIILIVLGFLPLFKIKWM
jgi:uncharacterized BrkB/YihY/UPF0761 family membrane protein